MKSKGFTADQLAWARKELLKDMNEKYPKITWFEENIYWPIWRKLRDISEIPQKLKWFYQRGTRGYADCDWWNLNDYLASWLPNALKDFRKNHMGYPGTKSMSTPEEWEKALKTMEEGFRAHTKLTNLVVLWSSPKGKELQKKQKEGLALFVKYFNNLWD